MDQLYMDQLPPPIGWGIHPPVPLLSQEVIEACKSGDGPRVVALINSGAAFYTRAYREWTTKHFHKNHHAPYCKETVIMRQLLRICSLCEHLSIVEWLLAYGFPKNAAPAACAMYLGSIETLEYLIKVDPFLPRRARYHHETYMYVALVLPEWKAMMAVETLLKHGANPNYPDNFMKGVITTGSVRLVALVDAWGGKPDKIELIESAADSGSVDVVRYLLECGANVDHKFDPISSMTGLQYAAQNGDKTMVRFLLDSGADASVETRGKRALDFARDISDDDVRVEVIALLSGR